MHLVELSRCENGGAERFEKPLVFLFTCKISYSDLGLTSTKGYSLNGVVSIQCVPR